MRELQVGLGERSYPIEITTGTLGKIGEKLGALGLAKRYAVITDAFVAHLYGSTLMNSLEVAGVKAQLFSFPRGEASKNLDTLGRLAGEMATQGFDRGDGILAFGGGVPGDVAGFLASTYMRGIPFVQVPTTLLAQVDSSVGGKTGVDIPEGKNLVGTFYQPKAVFIDPAVLVTLPQEEILGGLAEVIKYGVIWDGEFFAALGRDREKILALDPATIEDLILTCCRIKAEVVSRDEREGGLRRILNFGHTIGHAVEAASKFAIIHGLAVSIGMVAAARLAVLCGYLDEAERDQIHELLLAYGLPTEVPEELDRKAIKKYLLTDKKTVGGRIHFVLPRTLGKVEVSSEISEKMIDEVLAC
jgi:3-dehydroquinate synthase